MFSSNDMVGVWGAGREGQAVARRLVTTRRVVVVDENRVERPAGLVAGVDYQGGLAALDRLRDCSLVVASPGVPRVHPFRDVLSMLGIPVTSPTALWMSDHSQKTIGITGTKGKSTTAALTHYILDQTGIASQLAGNIGLPLSDITDRSVTVVAELSSYQCAYLDVSPRVAVITNLYQDHLPWHGGLDRYWLDKARIYSQGAEVLICSGRTLSILAGLKLPLPPTVQITEDVLLPQASLHLLGDHNVENLKLALLASETVGSFDRAVALERAKGFKSLPHRLETISNRDERVWVDDTLSTTAESVVAAVKSFPGRELVLIVGGLDRGIDYSPIVAALIECEPAVKLVCLPDNGLLIAGEYATVRPECVLSVATMGDAVLASRSFCRPGAVIILSPGAPSQNMYTDFEAKSADFASAIKALP